MHFRKTLTIAVAALTVTACADEQMPTQSTLEPSESQLVRGPVANNDLLTDIPVTQTLDGSTLEGLLSITELALQDGELVASGTLTGTVTDALGNATNFTQTFTDTALDLLGSGNGGSCDILNLDLGPIHLDLLGLVVDLSAIELDITAERGPGNLLGNLLCAVAGLLDQDGPLSGIDNLLNQINSILG